MREIILMVLVALSVPLVLKRPLLGVLIYLGANVVRPEMLFWGGGGGSYVFKIYYLLIIVASFARGYLARLGRLTQREFLLMIWLITAVSVSLLFAQYQVFRGSYYAVEMLKTLIICAFIYMVADGFDDVKKMLNVLLWCFAFLGLWGIEQQFRGNERLEGLGGSAWGDSNGVAAVFVMFLPVALAKLYTSENRKAYWRAAGIVAIMVALIVCTKSRGGLVGLVVAVAAYAFFAGNVRKIVVAAVLMLLAAMPFATEAYLERMKTMQSSETLDGSGKSRLVLWEAGLMVFADNPLFGTGFLTYPQAKMEYKHRFLDLDEEFHSWVFREEAKKVTHNTYIQILSDCGLFGAVPFMLLISGAVLSGMRARRLRIIWPEKSKEIQWLCGLSAGITGFAVCIIAIDALLQPFLYIQLVFTGICSRLITSGGDTA